VSLKTTTKFKGRNRTMITFLAYIKVLWKGIKDGFYSLPLSMGMTYPNQKLNTVYDYGANIGQILKYRKIA
jgi:hypothetical protein